MTTHDALLRRLKEAKFQCIDGNMEETAADFDDAIFAITQLQRDNAALMEDAAAQIQIAKEAVERAAGLERENDMLRATQAACDAGSCEHDGCQRKDLVGYREMAAEWVDKFYGTKRDAARYRWLFSRFTGYDFDWMSTHAHSADGKSVAVFEVGREFRGSRDIGSSIDAAIAKEAR